MPTLSQVHQAIDDQTAITLAGIPLLYGSMIDPGISEGTATWVRQNVQFQSNSQRELTKCFRRHRGYVIFYVHWRRGTGDNTRNLIQTSITKDFCSTTIGGATFQDSRSIPVRGTENWEILGIQVPFYFDEVI